MATVTGKPKLIQISDLSLDPEASRYEKTVSVHVQFAEHDGEMDTLEGRVPFLAGDALLTGVIGEHWPVKRRVFDSLYELVHENEPALYRKKKGLKAFAKQIQGDFQVKIRDGSATLVGKPGDWLIQNSGGELGIVANDIFLKSYRRVAREGSGEKI